MGARERLWAWVRTLKTGSFGDAAFSLKIGAENAVNRITGSTEEIPMSDTHTAVLNEANAAVSRGDYEGFLAFCTEDTDWTFVGDRTLKGKEAVRRYMAETYREPPVFRVERMIAEGDFVTAIGEITLKDEDGKATDYAYCDVWRFRDGRMAELQAFVIETGPAR